MFVSSVIFLFAPKFGIRLLGSFFPNKIADFIEKNSPSSLILRIGSFVMLVSLILGVRSSIIDFLRFGVLFP